MITPTRRPHHHKIHNCVQANSPRPFSNTHLELGRSRRCAILGLDRVEDDLPGTAGTLVIGGDAEQYVAGLKALVRVDGVRPLGAACQS